MNVEPGKIIETLDKLDKNLEAFGKLYNELILGICQKYS
jgi:hypothetical protein